MNKQLRKLIPHRHNWVMVNFWYNGGEYHKQGNPYPSSGAATSYVCSFCEKELKV